MGPIFDYGISVITLIANQLHTIISVSRSLHIVYFVADCDIHGPLICGLGLGLEFMALASRPVASTFWLHLTP